MRLLVSYAYAETSQSSCGEFGSTGLRNHAKLIRCPGFSSGVQTSSTTSSSSALMRFSRSGDGALRTLKKPCVRRAPVHLALGERIVDRNSRDAVAAD